MQRCVLTALVFALSLLAGPAEAFVHIRSPIDIPMRDGQSLAADVYLPAADGAWPVVLIQTPYNKDLFAPVFLFEFSQDPLLKSSDYAFVVLDWRGFFASAGAAHTGSPSRGEDGHDAVEWIAAQSWCDGNVGTWGASALGNVQMRTAAEQPPHLRGCVPIVYHWREWYDQCYPGGVYARNRNEFVYGLFGGLALIRAHPLRDALWDLTEVISGTPALIDVPMLHVSGWYDHETLQTIREMRAVDTEGGDGARGNQWLLIGPWSHSHVGASTQGELSFPAAEWVSSQWALDFFDHFLRGIDNGFDGRATVTHFQINDDVWSAGATWPPASSETSVWRLHSDASLRLDTPLSASASLEYTSDPTNPVPTVWGAVLTEATGQQGPGDLSAIEARADVLAFTTAPMTAPLKIAGNPVANLWIECDAVDTDVAVRLTQVYPDGRSVLLVDGIRRASLSGSFSTPEFLEPGTPRLVPVELPPIAATIPVGHRLRVLVAPSNWDRFDVNMQDGSSLSDEAGATPTPATVHLLLNSEHVSDLELPILGGDTTGLTLR